MSGSIRRCCLASGRRRPRARAARIRRQDEGHPRTMLPLITSTLCGFIVENKHKHLQSPDGLLGRTWPRARPPW
uniref:Uncharacterized protein n=1 Tax=Triticum urartu TaxID=4572 RepID=A0A8R7UBK9_TRIUA